MTPQLLPMLLVAMVMLAYAFKAEAQIAFWPDSAGPILANPISTPSATFWGNMGIMSGMNVSGTVRFMQAPSVSGSLIQSDGNGNIGYANTTAAQVFNANVWSGADVTRSLVTGTGATGFQISTTRNADVEYNVKISVTATIGAQSEGYIVLETAPTNSATPSDWKECGRFSNGQNITLAIALQSTQPIGADLGCSVPAGYWVKLRQVTVSGTPTFSYVSGYEVLK